jgi:H+/Cl- antiporter ClcA
MTDPSGAPGAEARPPGAKRARLAVRVGVFGLFAAAFVTPLGGAEWVLAKVFFGLWLLAVVAVAIANVRSADDP